MLFRVLGPLEVDTGAGGVVGISGRPGALLACLLQSPRQAVPVHRLAELIWGEEQPENSEQAIQTNVGRLRRVLGPLAGCVVTRSPGYLLAADEEQIDASRFEQLCREARRQDDPARAAGLLDEALGLWRGPAFGEYADAVAATAAVRLEELRVDALEDRAATALLLGALSDAVVRASDLVRQHPYRERPVGLLMRGLYEAGRTAEALDAYRAHRDLLADELGIDPSESLSQLEQGILRGDLPRRAEAAPAARRAAPTPSAAAHVASVAAPRPVELPSRPSAMVGREVELARLRSLLDDSRLVTVVGPGGVGKTRVALELAHRAAQAGERVWWVDLVPIGAGQLLDAITGSLGVERVADRGGSAATFALAAQLEAHQGLLVLDNAEHVLDAVAPVVERLLDTVPGVVTLVTSRERLALDGETVVPLPPLAVPEPGERDNAAVRLFTERARLDVAMLPEPELGLVVDACRRLDGLPLAIELAAARAGTLGLSGLVGRLEDRLDLLGGGRRTAGERHRTLRRVVDWSFGLLAEDEARLLARLSVFPSPFTLEQAEAVGTVDGQRTGAVVGSLARLVEQSLVQSSGDAFSLLETVRAYAREHLSAAEELAVRARHAGDTAERLAALTPVLWSSEEPHAVEVLNALRPHLISAWEYAAEHDRALGVRLAADVWDYAYFRQRLELLNWSTHVAAWDIEHPDLARALAAAACAAWADGRLDVSQQLVDRAIPLAGGPDAPDAVLAVDIAADLHMFAGRIEEAVAGYRTAARSYRRLGMAGRALSMDLAAGQASSYGSRRDELVLAVPELLERAEELRIPTILAFAYFVAGQAWLDRDVDAALSAFETGAAHGRRADSRLFVMMSRTAAVGLLAKEGPVERAFEVFEDVLLSWEDAPNRANQWGCLCHLMLLLDRAGLVPEAATLVAAIDGAQRRHEVVGALGQYARQRYDTAAARLRAQLPALGSESPLSLAQAVAFARRVIAAELAAGRAPAGEPMGETAG